MIAASEAALGINSNEAPIFVLGHFRTDLSKAGGKQTEPYPASNLRRHGTCLDGGMNGRTCMTADPHHAQLC